MSTELKTLYTALLEQVESTKEDAEDYFEKNKKVASTRLRKKLQEVKKLSQQLRLAISTAKKEEKEAKAATPAVTA
jgi:hypothetical protein